MCAGRASSCPRHPSDNRMTRPPNTLPPRLPCSYAVPYLSPLRPVVSVQMCSISASSPCCLCPRGFDNCNASLKRKPLVVLLRKGVVGIAFLLLRTTQVECVAVVIGERDVLPDAANEIRIRDEIAAEGDDRVRVLIGGDMSGLAVEPTGDQERARTPEIVLHKKRHQRRPRRLSVQARHRSPSAESSTHDEVEILVSVSLDDGPAADPRLDRVDVGEVRVAIP